MRFDYLSVLLAVVVATPIFADITDYIADIPACGVRIPIFKRAGLAHILTPSSLHAFWKLYQNQNAL